MDQDEIVKIGMKLDESTEDEDVRQDVWVAILETGDTDASAHLARILLEKNQREEMQERVVSLIFSQPSNKIMFILDRLSPNQQSVALMIMLGYPIDYIARYKNMCNLRFAQTLRCIAKHEAWEECLVEERTNPI